MSQHFFSFTSTKQQELILLIFKDFVWEISSAEDRFGSAYPNDYVIIPKWIAKHNNYWYDCFVDNISDSERKKLSTFCEFFISGYLKAYNYNHFTIDSSSLKESKIDNGIAYQFGLINSEQNSYGWKQKLLAFN